MDPEAIAKWKDFAGQNGILPMGDPEQMIEALASSRPRIRLPGDNRELGQFASEVGVILARENIFRRDLTPVTVNVEKKRTDPIDAEWLRSWAEYHLCCFKDREIGSGKETRVIAVLKTMNLDTARGTLRSPQFFTQLNEIERVNPIRLPLITTDNRIELAPLGYDQASRIYTLENEIVYDLEMSQERAGEIIRDLLFEFPFQDGARGRSLAVQVAAMLTVFAVGILPKGATRPGFIYTANDSDAGKTLLVKCAVVPIKGSMRSQSFPRKEELRKVLDQIAMDGETTILFDNVKGTLGGEAIESFMSSEQWGGRILGEKGGFSVENVTTCFFTGNDSAPTRDMAQRCLFVELFLEQVDSSKRRIKRVLTDNILKTPALRSEICSALWALVRHWDAAGRPTGTGKMPKNPEWAKTIAAIVETAGFGDPCAKPLTADVGEANEMERLVRALVKHADNPGGTHKWKFAEIVDVVKKEGLFENDDFIATLASDAKESKEDRAARSAFAIKLKRFGGRVFTSTDGEPLRFRVEGTGHARHFLAAAC